MLDRADAILKIAIAIAVLCAGLSVAYYYVLLLPAQAAEKNRQEQTAEQALLQAEQARLQDERHHEQQKSADQELARNRYNSCVSVALSNYNNRWSISCQRQHDSDAAQKASCLQNQPYSQFCANMDVRPAFNCGLQSSLADSYGADLAKDKELCLDQLKAGA